MTALPTINLNGSAASTLYELNFDAVKKLDEAIEFLAKAAPHGRDYQIGPVHWWQVLDEHQRRMERLVATREELLEITESILRQTQERT